MPQLARAIRIASILTACAGFARTVAAQDSVSNTPNVGGDALSAYGTQTVRYIVDLVKFDSMWGSDFAIGPILKATNDPDVLFNTLVLGSASVSADQRTNVSLGSSVPYSVWTSRGAGIGPSNGAPGAVSVSAFDRQFGVGISDLNADATNVIGAIIGVQNSNITRLHVRRTNAAHSRVTAGTEDTGTVSLGAIDADGYTGIRADGFNGTGSNKIAGENMARVNLGSRSAGLNGIFKSGTNNAAFDGASTTFLINNGTVTTNTPASLPTSIAGSPTTLRLDFSNKYGVNGGAGVTTHLDSAMHSHRGNPAFYAVTNLGGVGTVSMLARSNAGAGKIDSINLTAVNAAGGVVAVKSATLPVPMPGAPSLNASGTAEFTQYLSQVGFRGPDGLVGVGIDSISGNLVAAATATDPVAGDFIAVARFPGGAPVWKVAAYEGEAVKDGPTGAIVGAIGNGSPISISAPAIDRLGNVYFVGVYDPTVGPPVNALFKAVNTASGYALEVILKEGDGFVGANSASPYTVEKLALGDSDSLASAGFNGGQVLQPQIVGHTTTDPASPFAAGGVLVNATITYNNLGNAESYEAALFIEGWAAAAPACTGDVNGDGHTNIADFNILTGSFGHAVTPNTSGDLTGDGIVNISDFNILAGNFGC